MSAYYSSQTTIEAKVKALRIKMWGDKDGDGVLDPAALESALSEAKQEILLYVETRYGQSVTDGWDSSTRPDWIGTVSDWLTLYHLMSGSNAAHPVVIKKYDDVLKQLIQIQNYQAAIPGITFESGQTNTTTRMQYLECTDEDAALGLCDPCGYQYT
jgi:hypothetical protein